jgi:radical SAM protein with 4Fe4S-binding SPASM domain
MELSFYKDIIDQIHPSLFYLNLHFQGEPYLHPQFTEMVHYAKSKKLYVSTSTNGHFLTSENIRKTIASGLDRLIISLDGTDPETYSHYRKGGNLDQVIEGIKEFVRIRREYHSGKPKIILQFIVLRSNQHQLKEIRKLSKMLDVDKLELKTAQLCDFKNGNPLMTDLPEYCRYKKSGSSSNQEITYEIRNKLPNRCFRMWTSCVITWDGWVVPCCFDKDATYRMGNLNSESFIRIWKSDLYFKFRKKILTSRKEIPICRNCTEE